MRNHAADFSTALLILALLCVLTTGIAAQAATLRVPSEHPTIQTAMDLAAAGDTVLVAPGTYDEWETRTVTSDFSSVVFMTDGVTLLSEAGPASTTLRMDDVAPGTPSVITIGPSTSQPTRLEGFTVTGTTTNLAGLHSRNSEALTIRQCRFVDLNQGPAIHSDHDRLYLEESQFIRCDPNNRSAASVSLRVTRFDISDCLFEECVEPLYAGQNTFSSPNRVTDTVFIRNVGAVEIIYVATEFERCSFLENSEGALWFRGYVFNAVRDCLFSGNTQDGSYHSTLGFSDGRGAIKGCTFVENESDPVVRVRESNGDGAIQINIARNVFAFNRVGPILEVQEGILGGDPQGRCNLFWNPEAIDYTGYNVKETDFFLDPQFCDRAAGDFSVTSSSPCLPDHNTALCVNQIGAFGVGCGPGAETVVSLRTNPAGLSSTGDGSQQLEPALFGWAPGSSHTIAVTAVDTTTTGSRFTFNSWSDGGAVSHDIVVPGSFTELTAHYDTEFLLTTMPYEGGAVTPGGWADPGTSRFINATPLPGWRFSAWVGTGEGAYTGTENPASVVMNGPITQVAAFSPLHDQLTMQVQGAGTVTPPSGIQDRGAVLTIEAFPSPGWAFDRWIGDGAQSYSGANNPAIILMNGDITQTAVFLVTARLTMLANPGGQVSPASGPHILGSVVTIEATADEDFGFVRWAGTGLGSYAGQDNPTTVTVNGPITQTAVFAGPTPQLTMLADPEGQVSPASGPQDLGSLVTIEATADDGFGFAGWTGTGFGSYTGPNNPAEVTMNDHLSETAHFDPLLTTLAEGGGSVTPETAPHARGTSIDILATPDNRHIFREWRGSGSGAYSGPDPGATVSVNDPTVQVAHFDPIGYEISLSLSNTDPQVSTGPPIGLGKVYLWLACGTAGGLTALEADVAGSLSPFVFTTAPGVLNAGDHRHLSLVTTSCITGPALLGEFTVLPPGEGAICLATSGAGPSLTVTGCNLPGEVFAWPQDIRFTGASTNGVTPCDFGRGCDDEAIEGNTPVGVVAVAPLPIADALESVAPNPFANETTIRFALRASSRVRLTVFDVSGRRVRTLVDRTQDAGTHTILWNGRNESGRELPPSVYFVRLETGEYTGTKKLTLLGRR